MTISDAVPALSENWSLLEPATLPVRPPTSVVEWGPTVVVAPHPDDESIGCGGAIRLLREHGIPVRVLFISDGTGSHPSSRSHPANVLRDLREREAHDALLILGVEPGCAVFLRLPDRFIPNAQSPDFDSAVHRIADYLRAFARDEPTIVVPWRRDPHSDHRAAWEPVQAATPALPWIPHVIEYPLWIWKYGAPEDYPREQEMHAWQLDIGSALETKFAAIHAHESQTTGLISDDPEGFRLTPKLLARFTNPWEIYLEPTARPAPEFETGEVRCQR